MLPLLTHPLALIGLVALPTLTAIYFFRQRHRRYVVSSLMLWQDIQTPGGGGDRLRRLETPLLFALETAALLLLVLAAANPLFFSTERAQPLVVVLDDSFSMLAGGKDSSRDRAVASILDELRRRPRPSIRFLLAGERPQLLGDPVTSAGEAGRLLADWKCLSRTARLNEALALAGEIGGEHSLFLVVTDRATRDEPGEGRLQWWAFGEPRPNHAFVAASRSWRGDEEQVSFTVANLSPDATSTSLVVTAGQPSVELARRNLSLSGRAETTMGLTLPPDTAEIHATLDEDALAIDNRVVLVPVPRRPVRVALEIGAEALRRPVEKALKANRAVVLTGTKPDLVVTDGAPAADLPAETWVARIQADKEAEAWLGPFVLDRGHPLTQGLSFQGVLWGAGKSQELPGRPVVLAGSVPLVAETQSGDRREIVIRWRPDLSTLQDTPAWPALWFNLVQWRASALPGWNRVNVRLGEEVVRTFADDPGPLQARDPEGNTREVMARDHQLTMPTEVPGLHTLLLPDGTETYAVNPLNRNESDLAECSSGQWGTWLTEGTLRLEYRGITGPLLLTALAVLSLHLLVAARRRGA